MLICPLCSMISCKHQYPETVSKYFDFFINPKKIPPKNRLIKEVKFKPSLIYGKKIIDIITDDNCLITIWSYKNEEFNYWILSSCMWKKTNFGFKLDESFNKVYLIEETSLKEKLKLMINYFGVDFDVFCFELKKMTTIKDEALDIIMFTQ